MATSISKSILNLLPSFLRTKIRRYRRRQIVSRWKKNGSIVPPPHQVKQLAIEEYAAAFRCKTLVETGTYLGDMVFAQLANFDKIYSVELSKELWVNAKKRFNNESNVELLNGDSGTVLYDLLPRLNDPAIFWLDGHYSGGVTAKGAKECPVFEEIDAILGKGMNDNIILIDDARMFIGANDYPDLATLENYIHKKSANYKMEVKDDIIRITPGKKEIFKS